MNKQIFGTLGVAFFFASSVYASEATLYYDSIRGVDSFYKIESVQSSNANPTPTGDGTNKAPTSGPYTSHLAKTSGQITMSFKPSFLNSNAENPKGLGGVTLKTTFTIPKTSVQTCTAQSKCRYAIYLFRDKSSCMAHLILPANGYRTNCSALPMKSNSKGATQFHPYYIVAGYSQ